MGKNLIFSSFLGLKLSILLLFVVLTSICSEMAGARMTVKAKVEKDSLYLKFLNPPNSAKPRVWWHWMNGDITIDGIKKDLQWMHRSGIGGFQNFNVTIDCPPVVDKRLPYMSPEWKDAFKYATRLADSLHLEMGIAASPGWSESGGPWVKAKDGMKKYVWSETSVTGDHVFNGLLPQPPATVGPFQNAKKKNWPICWEKPLKVPEYYRDVAVIAFKLADKDIPMKDARPEVTSSGGHITLESLTDGDISAVHAQKLPHFSYNYLQKSWIQFDFKKPVEIKAITIASDGGERILASGDDGSNFREILSIPERHLPQQTIDIQPATARYFRVMFVNPKGNNVAEIVLHNVSRVNNFENKAAFGHVSLKNEITTPAEDAINISDVINLTDKMKADGSLEWNVPAGNWKIVRFGYSLLGNTNIPAPFEALGLEVDKLDSAAVKRYFTDYLEKIKDATGGLMGDKGGLRYMVNDSWEAGSQNWTGNMMEEFQKRCGYSMVSWMPVLAGYVVKSAQASDNFLWDFRKVLSEMVAEYHYDQLTDILKKYGMKRYTESHECMRALIADGMDIKRYAAVPMSAMWAIHEYNNTSFNNCKADIRESASVAHIYGQNLVAAESLSTYGGNGSAFSYCPEDLKPIADLELANGLNRFIIHTSAHQPLDEKIPGTGLQLYGQWFTRHETWAEQSLPWTTYLARSSYLLQQGNFVADVVYYYGEDNNITSLFGEKLPDIPEGYNYDFINSDALIRLLSVKDGKLVTPGGMSYQLLALDSNAVKMSLPVLRKIEKLVKEGATVCGIEPQCTPSLSDDPEEFDEIVKEIWHSENPRVFTGKTISEALKKINIIPDFIYTKPSVDTKLLYVHRKLTDRDIYWVNNRVGRTQNVEISFRINGKVPKIWHPETKTAEPVSYRIADDITKVKLHLQPEDALFVVFKDKALKQAFTLPEIVEEKIAKIDGQWDVSFQENRGAPASVRMDTLKSWTENENEGIKYFSGTATYTKRINADRSWFKKGSRLWIDLGEVKNIAEVKVNGKSQGIAWKKPFRVEMTKSLRPGENTIEVKITNLWVNRIIGDEQPGVKKKITYTTINFYMANSPLLISGLLGPVEIIREN